MFFWSQKTGNQVDYADYTAWLANKSQPPLLRSTAPPRKSLLNPPVEKKRRQLRKQRLRIRNVSGVVRCIVELITTGKTDQIPGIRDIPLKINEEPPTQPTMDRPLKPWEKAVCSTDEIPSTTATSTMRRQHNTSGMLHRDRLESRHCTKQINSNLSEVDGIGYIVGLRGSFILWLASEEAVEALLAFFAGVGCARMPFWPPRCLPVWTWPRWVQGRRGRTGRGGS